MTQPDIKKKDRQHLRCVVCGKNVCSLYDETLRAFPIYHLKDESNPKKPCCEDRFFEALLRIYVYLHKQSNTISINELIVHFDWLDLMMMKKEMVTWCLARGYLSVDNLKRISIPPPVDDSCKNLFESIRLDDPKSLQMALVILKGALEALLVDLKPVPADKMPIEKPEVNLGESTLYDNIDTSNVELKSEKKGMATADMTGAKELEKRFSIPSAEKERKRLDD